jgi:hypothetical protein
MGRVVQPGDPQWLPMDRGWALALLQVEADSCPDCGQPWGEVTSPDNESAYRADLIRCHACAAGALAVRAHQDQNGKTDGLHVHVEKRNGR